MEHPHDLVGLAKQRHGDVPGQVSTRRSTVI
jgi:hypothetical protein